ncbi:MAG: hypothetical protein JO038_00505 [Alphaproteobacteria bacterium]|nr:hypothetical protein [Alphaproteobacteria bacterium]
MYILLAAVITVVLSGICLESYKRHRDRQGVASAIGGEIYSILNMQRKRQTARFFATLLQRLDSGEKVDIPDLGGGNDPLKIDPVVDKHIDRLGSLPDNMPERIATFYTYLRGIRVDLANLSRGVFTEPTAQANIIRADLALWADAEHLGTSLGSDLRRIATESWWPIAWSQVVVIILARILWRARGARTESLAQASSPAQPSVEISANRPDSISFFHPPYQDFVANIQTQVNMRVAELMTRLEWTRENALQHVATDFCAALRLECVSRFLFGSQIDALEFLGKNNSQATINEIERFFTAASIQYPGIYANYTFKSWLGFLEQWALIEVRENFVTLLDAGKAVVPYMEARGYLASRPVG